MKRNIIKTIALILAAAVLVLAFAACEKNEKPLTTDNKNSSEQPSKTEANGSDLATAEPSKTDTPVVTTEAAPVGTTAHDAPPVDPAGFVPGETTFEFNDITIEDNDSYCFKVVGIDLNKELNNYNVKFSFENKTDVVLILTGDPVFINGYAFNSDGIYKNIDTKSTASIGYEIPVNAFSQYNISGLDLIEFTYFVRDIDYKTIGTAKAEFSPTGIDPAGFTTPDRLHVDGEAAVFEKGDAKAEFLGISKEESTGNYNLLFYVENNSKSDKQISVNSLILNSWDIGSSDSLVLLPGHGGYLDVNVYKSTLDDIGFKEDLIDSAFSIGGYIDVYDLYETEETLTYDWKHDVIIDGKTPEIPDCPFRSEGKVVLETPHEVIVSLVPDTLSGSYCQLSVYFSNEKNRDLHYVLDNVKVNGKDVFASIYSSLLPETKSIDSSSIDYNELRDIGITEITSVEFKVEISDDFTGVIAEQSYKIETNIPVPEE